MSKNTHFSLQNKAKRKYKDSAKLWALAHLESDSKKAYLSSIYCASTIRITDGKTQTKYCKNKCCTVCNSIRAKQRYNRLADRLTGKMQFTTLTVPNCKIDELGTVQHKMKKALRQIINTINKRHPQKIWGVYNIEKTINTNDKNYHPHIHILHSQVECNMTGHARKPYIPKKADRKIKIGKYSEGTQQTIYYENEITKLWLKHFPDAQPYLQHVVPLHESDDMNKREVFKYSCKPFAFTKKRKDQTYQEYREEIKENFTTWVKMYDALFTYERKNRCRNFATFGMGKPELSEDEENNGIGKESDTVENIEEGNYQWHEHDWYNVKTGEPLSEYIPDEKQKGKHSILNKIKNYESDHEPPDRTASRLCDYVP